MVVSTSLSVVVASNPILAVVLLGVHAPAGRRMYQPPNLNMRQDYNCGDRVQLPPKKIGAKSNTNPCCAEATAAAAGGVYGAAPFFY